MSPLGKIVKEIQKKDWQKKVLMPLTPSTQNGYPMPFLLRLKHYRMGVRPEDWNRADICPWCQNDIVNHTIEHAIPKSQGGTDAIRNLVWACRECNEARGSTPIMLWLLALSQVPDRKPQLAKEWVKTHAPKPCRYKAS